MSLRRRLKKEFLGTVSSYNETSEQNVSHRVDSESNFFLRPINYENIDSAVFIEFNKRFTISNKQIGLIILDAEIASLQTQNFEQFDKTKGYLNLPYFLYWRSGVAPLYRVSPANKPIIYSVPVKKAQGVVYEEYIMPWPKMEKLTYSFKFISTYREHINQFEEQMNEYFKNKRNVLVLDNERFEIMPSDQDNRGTLEVGGREGVEGQSIYTLTYDLDVIAYTRKLEDIQKRERPNILDIQITEKSGPELTTITQITDRFPKNLE